MFGDFERGFSGTITNNQTFLGKNAKIFELGVCLFVLNLFYASKRSEMALEGKLIGNKYIIFLITWMKEIWKNERLFF